MYCLPVPPVPPSPHLLIHHENVLARLQHCAPPLLPLHRLLQKLRNGGQARTLPYLRILGQAQLGGNQGAAEGEAACTPESPALASNIPLSRQQPPTSMKRWSAREPPVAGSAAYTVASTAVGRPNTAERHGGGPASARAHPTPLHMCRPEWRVPEQECKVRKHLPSCISQLSEAAQPQHNPPESEYIGKVPR